MTLSTMGKIAPSSQISIKRRSAKARAGRALSARAYQHAGIWVPDVDSPWYRPDVFALPVPKLEKGNVSIDSFFFLTLLGLKIDRMIEERYPDLCPEAATAAAGRLMAEHGLAFVTGRYPGMTGAAAYMVGNKVFTNLCHHLLSRPHRLLANTSGQGILVDMPVEDYLALLKEQVIHLGVFKTH